MGYLGLSNDAEHVLDIIRAWIAYEHTGKPTSERRYPTICDLGMLQGGIYRTEFPASRIRKAIGELFGVGMIDVFTPGEFDMGGPQWRPTNAEQRRTM